MRTLFVIALLFLGIPVPLKAQLGCSAALRKAFEELVEEFKDNKQVYVPQACSTNAIELSRKFEGKFASDSRVVLSSLNLLLLRHQHLKSLYLPAEKVPQTHWLRPRLSRETTQWKYHTVLEYEGFILDLDMQWVQVAPLNIYMKMQFPEADQKNLLATRLPSRFFRTVYPRRPVHLVDLTELANISTTLDLPSWILELKRKELIPLKP